MRISERRQMAFNVFGEYKELFTESGLQNIKKLAKQYKDAEM